MVVLIEFVPFFFLHRLGLEGLVMFKQEPQFDPENYQITIPTPSAQAGETTTISVFDKVQVQIEVEKDKNTQRGKVKMTLVGPVDLRETSA